MKPILKRYCIIIGILVLICTIMYLVYVNFFYPYRGTVETYSPSASLSESLTKEEAIEDLSFIIKRLKERHPACMKGVPKEVLDQYDNEVTKLGDDVTVLQIWQASTRILAKLKDAHTGIGYNGEDTGRLPIKFEMIDNVLYCVSENYAGSIVHSINGIPTDTLYQTYLRQFSYELESYASFLFSKHIRMRYYLEFVGVDTSSDITVTFITDEGIQEEVFVFNVPVPEKTSSDTPFVFFEIDKENSLGILTLRSCNYNDYYKETVKKFFAKVKENHLEYVAVDLRNNGGGNSMVVNEFLRYLNVEDYYTTGGMDVRYGPILYSFKKNVRHNHKYEDLLFNGKVYALTASNTFSSAMMFAVVLSDNKIGQLIGEVPGNMPASYGDILTFLTPNSKLIYTVSFKYFNRIDEAKSHMPLIPDYEVKAEAAMDKLYELIK